MRNRRDDAKRHMFGIERRRGLAYSCTTMKNLDAIFGDSPYEAIAAHAEKVQECVALLRPVADAIVSGGSMENIRVLQEQMSGREFEADKLRSTARSRMGRKLFLTSDRDDLRTLVRQLDRLGDDAEAFAIAATYRHIQLPQPLHDPFLKLVDKVVAASSLALKIARNVVAIEQEAFEGLSAKDALQWIDDVCYMEWESDRLGQDLAHAYFGLENIDPILVLLLEKMSAAILGVADHADNVARSLRGLIRRR